MRNRITYLTTGLTLGGAEIQLTRLAIGMQGRGWDVKVLSMLPPIELTDELIAAGVEVDTLNMSPIPNPLAIVKLARVLRADHTHILHSHMAKANFLGRISGRLARVPVQISTAHNIVEGGKWIELGYKITDSLADVTTNVSQRAIDRYVAIGAVSAAKARLMYNGLDTTSFERSHQTRLEYRQKLRIGDQFCWLAVGRLSPSKDYPNMIRAFRRVLSEQPEATLIIVGKGDEEPNVRSLISSEGISSKVHMFGQRKDIPALMCAADAHVMSSAWEGAPMVLLEASASSLPVVATDVGGNSELVVDGKTGLIVPPGDDAALAEGMLKIMAMPEEDRARLGSAGHEYVERQFGLPIVLDRWETLYRSILNQKAE